MVLWTTFGLLYAWSILASLWCWVSLSRFLARYPTLADEGALGAFKRLARVNMVLALLQIGVMVSGACVGILLILRHGVVRGLGAVLLANGIVLALGKILKPLEARVRSLPAATEALAAEHARVSETWVSKPFPDF